MEIDGATALRTLLVSAAAVSAAMLLVPLAYTALHAWIRLPYACAMVSAIVASIAAASRLERRRAEGGDEGEGGGSEGGEKGVVEARPYEEVVQEMEMGTLPGACGVALPFGEVLDVSQILGDGSKESSHSLAEKEKTWEISSRMPPRNLDAISEHVRRRKKPTVSKSQQDLVLLGEEELNRRIEHFIDSFNREMRLETE